MKKSLAILLVLLLAIPMSVMAAFEMKTGNAEIDEYIISNSSQSGKKAVLFVIDSSKTVEEIRGTAAGNHIINERVIYADSIDINSVGYEFKFTMTDSSDTFKALVSIDDDAFEVQEFSFYTKDVKRAIISAMSSGNISEAQVDSAISAFSLKAYQSVDKTEAAKVIMNLRKENNVFLSGDLNECMKQLKYALIISDLNKGREALFANGIFKYSEEMGIAKSIEWSDYVYNLNPDGKSAVKNAIFNKNIISYSDFINRFKSAVHLNILTNYKDLGSGHVSGKLTSSEYKPAYVAAGFRIDDLQYCTDKTAVYGIVADSQKTTLADLAVEFNNALTPVSNPDNVQGPGNGGGGGGGGGMASGMQTPGASPSDDTLGYIEPENTQIPENPILGASSYNDVAKNHWAFDYIDILTKAGILNGKGDGKFAPDDMVNRGEFAKMISLVADLEPDADSCNFADTINSWSRGYVGAAVKAGFISGIDENTFAPLNNITREQAATIIGRALGLDAPQIIESFADDSAISQWAKNYIYALKEAGILSGRGDNMFAPDASLTRAEAAKLISVVLDKIN